MSRVGRVQINRPGDGGTITPPTIPDDPPPTPPEPGDYLALLVADGAVAAWPLEESDATTVYADVIGSMDAIINQPTTTSSYASTPIGPAATSSPQFNGAGGFSNLPDDLALVVAHTSLLEIGTGDFAFECWMKPDAFEPAGSGYCPMTLVKPDLSNYMLSQLVGPNLPPNEGTFALLDTVSGGPRSPADYIGDTSVHHCVFTRRSGLCAVIIDGVEVGTDSPTPVSYDTDEVLNLAGIEYGFVPGYNLYVLHGQLAWCAFYNVGLTAEQAATHFAAVA